MKPRTTARLYWGLTGLFCLMMLLNGVSGLMHEQTGVAVMKQLGYPVYIMDITGVAKILGALALLQTKYRALKEWAYAGFAIDFVGAAASIAFAGMGFVATLPALVMLAVLFGMYFLWKRHSANVRQQADTPELLATYAGAAI
jgi:uncharacterized membrane protein